MVDNYLIAVHAFLICMLISLSVDEILVLRYGKWSTNFQGRLFNMEMVTKSKKHEICFICVHVQANVNYCLLQSMRQGFGFCKCICENCQIYMIYVPGSFCGISSASCFFFFFFFSCETIFFH